MKKLFLLLFSLFMFTGCGDNIYLNLETDPYLLTEYNVALYATYAGDPICGATVIQEGVVVTASHCVNSPGDYHVKTNDGSMIPVQIIGIDNFETTDVAILRPLFAFPPQHRALLSRQEPKLGEDVWVVGCPSGECDSLSKGIVSKLGVTGHHGMKMNQFDVTAWYGNSGGGIFNSRGDLVGVVSQFGPQFYRGWSGEAETGWMYGCTVEATRRVLRGSMQLKATDRERKVRKLFEN